MQLTVTSAAWTGEYSVLSGAGANTYTFSSSVATDFITITDDATNTAIAWGVSPLSYTFAFQHPGIFGCTVMTMRRAVLQILSFDLCNLLPPALQGY